MRFFTGTQTDIDTRMYANGEEIGGAVTRRAESIYHEGRDSTRHIRGRDERIAEEIVMMQGTLKGAALLYCGIGLDHFVAEATRVYDEVLMDLVGADSTTMPARRDSAVVRSLEVENLIAYLARFTKRDCMSGRRLIVVNKGGPYSSKGQKHLLAAVASDARVVFVPSGHEDPAESFAFGRFSIADKETP